MGRIYSKRAETSPGLRLIRGSLDVGRGSN